MERRIVKFDDLDTIMRKFEQSMDQYVMQDLYIVARLDGRGFTRLTKEVFEFETPFDTRFRDYMVETVIHLMNCGFRIVYGYTQSDEISLLFHKDDATFGRKTRKVNSVLAGEASAKLSLLLNTVACFDCRVVPLPSIERVKDYFVWRQEDAHRNSLNSHCYWLMRNWGFSGKQATSLLEGKSVSYKNELLFKNDINFNELPMWQKRGVGVYYNDVIIEGFNPVNNEKVSTTRKKLTVNYDLSINAEYADWVISLL